MSRKRWDPNPKGTIFIKKSGPRVSKSRNRRFGALGWESFLEAPSAYSGHPSCSAWLSLPPHADSSTPSLLHPSCTPSSPPAPLLGVSCTLDLAASSSRTKCALPLKMSLSKCWGFNFQST